MNEKDNTEKLDLEQSVSAILEFCIESLKSLGIEAFVCFAEVDDHIIAKGRSDFKFDMELILITLSKHGFDYDSLKGKSSEEARKIITARMKEMFKSE